MRKPDLIPTALAEIAAGRDHIRTSEYGRAINRSSHTIRKYFQASGECFGVQPVKVGNRLLWPVAAVAALLKSGARK